MEMRTKSLLSMVATEESRTEKYRRYREQMSGDEWRDVDRVNKKYYDLIDTTVSRKNNPTICDGVQAMGLQANGTYFKEFPYLKPDGIQRKFLPTVVHDVFHLVTRLGHTPEQEQWITAFDIAYQSGVNLGNHSHARALIKELGKDYFLYDAPYHHDPLKIVRPNARQAAVYYAAGLYFREKMDSFKISGLEKSSYEKRLEFAKDYRNSKNDSDPVDSPIIHSNNENDFVKHPYELVKLSHLEWSAITAVALGLKSPEETDYPKRLAPIKKALRSAGLFYNMKPWAEKVKMGMGGEEKDINSDNFRGPQFDPESFKTARQKRTDVRRL